MAVGGQGDDAIELKAARAVLLDVIELAVGEHHPITFHSLDRATLDIGVHPRGHFVVLICLTPREGEDIGVVAIGDLFGKGIVLRKVVSGGTYVYNDPVAFCSFCNKGLLRKAITLDEKESQYTHKRKECHNLFKKSGPVFKYLFRGKNV